MRKLSLLLFALMLVVLALAGCAAPPLQHSTSFMVSGSQYQALMDLLESPEQTNEGLRDLFARKAPWDAK